MAIRPKVLLYSENMAKKYTSYKNFLRGIDSQHTKSEYVNCLRNFMLFHKLDDYDRLAQSNSTEIDTLLTNYLDYLIENGVKASTQRANLVGIERFFIMNDCMWHKDRIRRGIHKDTSIPGGRVPITTDELLLILSHTKSLRTKCIVHILADTGMRPAGLSDPILRVKHLVEMKTPTGEKCYGLMVYDGSIEGYWSFLTPETTELIDHYLDSRKQKGENITDDTPLLTKEKNVGEPGMRTDHARHIIYNMIKSSGMKREKISDRRYDKSVMYMFRKRFNTILKLNNDVNSNIAEKLMAHKKGLDGTYLQPTREECFAEFVKAIPQLTIDPTERQKIEIAQKQKKIDELESKARLIEKQETRIRQLEGEEENKESILVTLQQKIETMEQNQKDEQKRFEQWWNYMESQKQQNLEDEIKRRENSKII